MDDLLSEFLTETSESLATLDVELVNLERNPNDTAILSNIFRLVHTIKGTCGFLGLPRLESLAHAAENVLGMFRGGELTVSPSSVTLILQSIDRIKESLAYIEANETEPPGDDKDLIDRLNLVASGGEAPTAAPAAPAAATPAAASGPVLSEQGFPVAADLLAEVEAAQAQGARAATEAEIAAAMAAERATEQPAEPVAAPPSPPATVAPPPAPIAQSEAPKESSVANQSIRVNVDLLENLMTLVSELVLTRNQLLQMVRGRDDSEFAAPLQRLSHITTDLQEGVMKTRMQPIGNAWAKLPRIVRDLALETHKKIDLQMYGAETELDRQVLELIKDPLTHMVRNSADHGLEMPGERLAAGKPEVGVITLNAYHEGGHIIIEIADDGRGLNVARIRQKALENGLASEAEIDGMTDQQVSQFIFRAGFSTAAQVTSVSGRGVGMDVVRTNIEKIGGTIELKTVQGRGTTFVIKIPLTLAIVSALIVECAKERFAIPQISVVELVRVTANSEHQLETINQAPVLRLRDRLLPLVNLSDLLRLGGEVRAEEEEIFIVVSQVGTYTFGIIVDRVFDTEEIVVKPVAPILRHISMFSGNTILGDGSVIMILDPNGIASATGEVAMAADHAKEEARAASALGDDRVSLLIFRSRADDLKAVPLALVARLEEIETSTIEYSYGKPVVQYRGQLMPLVGVTEDFRITSDGRQPVLVFTDRDRSMGLLVEEIVDIVEDHLKMELQVDQPGLIGTAVINGKATEVIDTGHYLTRAFGDWFGREDKAAFAADNAGASRVLFVDDSAFFRNLLSPLLSVNGYNVTAVDSADKALALREKGEVFDAIISDIEMPGMDGFNFARAVREDARWATTPMIALSSHATDRDFEEGRDAGFDDYVVKFDREAVMQVLKGLIGRTSALTEA
ncbi:CheA Signal transduction histidine Kinases (STHK) [uncultured Alphaproteobacteria bacterium]|uniref:Chemotaxis protein CheA n=1 Tax=uncultured Alphaproteobacteria bacterium TaxID=91750 RepID=A0A212JQG6_9PROT|nr:CheA Signal transduction histidine Kinases (STHK) [uncultured Alphaproteobacteria bacterium]